MKLRIALSLAFIALAIWPLSAQLNTDRVTEVGRNALYFEDYAVAIQHFNQVIDAKPHLAEAYYLRAIAKYSLEDFTGAEADATAAIDRNPFLPEAWEVRGVVRQCLGKNALAVKDYTHALSLLPYNRQLLFNKALAEEEAKLYTQADSTYSILLENYPGYDPAYVGRAQLSLNASSDTIAAIKYLEKALELNPRSVQALTLRAAINSNSDPKAAVADMDEAVRQQPDKVYLRVNRAVARYNAGDLNGALADFDFAVQAEPTNYAALFNRAMLRLELHDNDRALSDLNRLLALRPTDMRTLYNRAIVKMDKGDLDGALADASKVVEAYPEMFAAYALRGNILEKSGKPQKARSDYRRANFLAHRAESATEPDSSSDTPEDEGTTVNRFKALLTMDNDAEEQQSFNTAGLRGRIQDHASSISIQPIYRLSYYTANDASPAYVRQIQELNSSHSLPYVVYMTNSVPAITKESDAQRHFADIQRLGAIINSSKAKPIDYFARAMDYVVTRDYAQAIADLDSVIIRQPDFAPAYLQRAAVRVLLQESKRGEVTEITDSSTSSRLSAEVSASLAAIMADLDHALELDPLMAVAHYNRGTILLQMGADMDAIDSFTKALEIDPTLAPAWFNRGYARFTRGNHDGAVSDISHAAELGITSGYNLLKRMQNR